VINTRQTSIISSSTVSFYREDRSEFIRNKCGDNAIPPRRSLSSILRFSDTLNYLGFVLRSHSLFYCSVPKVATRTLLIFITYLHIRDELIPLIKNDSTSDADLSLNIYNVDYFNQMFSSSIKVKLKERKDKSE
jgi:hypothetical protein